MVFTMLNNLKNLLNNTYNLPNTSIPPTQLSNESGVDNGRNIILSQRTANNGLYTFKAKYIANMQRGEAPASIGRVSTHYKEIIDDVMQSTDLLWNEYDQYVTSTISIGNIEVLTNPNSQGIEFIVFSDSDTPITASQLSVPGNCTYFSRQSFTRKEGFKYSFTYQNNLTSAFTVKSIYLVKGTDKGYIPLAGGVFSEPQVINPNETFMFNLDMSVVLAP